jgi:pyridoxamine 5'-phosphate oxidase
MNVSEFILMALKKIQRGTVDRKSSFRLPVLSTSINNKIFQRIVIARNFNEHDHSLLIFTDRESQKYYQLHHNKNCSLLFWDQKQKLQVQVDGEAYIVKNKKTYLDKLNDKQRDDYKIIPFPGTKISSAKDYEIKSSDNRFEVINIKFKQMDILELSSTGHCRAKCIFTKNSQEEYWVAP